MSNWHHYSPQEAAELIKLIATNGDSATVVGIVEEVTAYYGDNPPPEVAHALAVYLLPAVAQRAVRLHNVWMSAPRWLRSRLRRIETRYIVRISLLRKPEQWMGRQHTVTDPHTRSRRAPATPIP